jgi:hypothetical protein
MKKLSAITILLTLFLTGCASSSVVVGKTRAPIDATQVKVYLHPPKKFEEIALVEASSKASFAIGDQAKMNVVITRLKEEAAKLGANGVLLGEAGEQYAGSVSQANGTATRNGNNANANTYGTSSAIFRKAGKGLAIFVIEE